MTMPLSYAFPPQPPPHPKTNGGKRGPSAPISIPSSNEDDDSDTSITDFSPPAPSRFVSLETSPNPNAKTSVLPLSNLPSPRGHITNKKTSLLYSPRNNNNNNINSNNSNNVSNNIVYHLNTLSTNTNHNSLNSIHNNDIICPNITNSGTAQGLATTNSNFNNLLPSTSLSKAIPPSISIPLNSNTNNSTIPSISNSALSPTITTTQNSNSTSNNHNSSSHDSSKENSCPSSSSPRNRSCSPTFAYEHDHDYENVASPCSSTASGPIYVRPPGFQYHAHEIVASSNKVKKKKTSVNPVEVREGLKKREATPPKLKPKRGTLPMKLRALPQSFWQQPNVAQQVSPATMFPILPPLCNKDTEEAMEERPITPPEDKEGCKRNGERKITVANTDLLFKLFEGIGEEKKTSQSKSKQINRQAKKMIPKSNTKGLFMGKDPFLMEDVTEKIFPQLTLEGSKHATGGGNTSLQLVTLREGDRTVTFPSLSNEQNYPQLLSELVMHI